jgi:hypothetical protein
VYKELKENPLVAYDVLGFVDSQSQQGCVPGKMILGGTDGPGIAADAAGGR